MTRPHALAAARQFRDGDPHALDGLMDELLPVATRVARTNIPAKPPAHLSEEDLVSVGVEAAWRCLVDFDEHVEGELEGYVAVCVRNAIVTELRRAAAAKRSPAFEVSGPAADRAAANVQDPRPNPYEAAVHSELREMVDALPEPERTILIRYYFLQDTDEAIAKDLGTTRMAILLRRNKVVSSLRTRYDS